MMLQKYFMKSVNRISKDFKQKELLPLKLVFFVQASTISVLYPYLTIHMRELGIDVEEAAIMSAVIPVIGIIMPPLAGMIADKIGNFKLLLALFSLIGGGAALLLLLVPVGRIKVTYPQKIIINFGCDLVGGHFQLGLSNDVFCDRIISLENSATKEFSLSSANFEGCGFVCQALNRTTDFLAPNIPEDPSSPQDVFLTGRSYTVQIKTEQGVKSYHYNLTKEDVPKFHSKQEILSERILSNDIHLRTSIQRLAPAKYFFPASDFSVMTCKNDEARTEGKNLNERKFACRLGDPEEGSSDNFVPSINESLTFELKKIDDAASSNGLNQFTSEFVHWSDGNRTENVTGTCQRPKNRDVSVFLYLHDPENNLDVLETLPLTDCQPRCLVTVPRRTVCSNSKEEVTYDPRLTFWIYLAIRVFVGIIGSTTYAMYEVAVIAILREQKADYGLQRIYASIGGMISSPLSGMLIDYASQGKGYTDFRPAFYLYAALKISTSLLMLFINLEFKKAATNVISDAIEVLKNVEVIALLLVCFVLGTAWGYIESFLFWFLEDLGGTRSLMGITITVGGIAGIPLLALSGPIINKFGHANVLFIGFVFYAVRLLGYSMIYNPYHCLFFEAMESITSSLAITAAVTYAAKLSTTTTDGSMQGLVGGVYFGVGRGAGSLIGGYLMKAFGTRSTYRILAVFAVVTGIIYYLFNQFYMKKRPQVEGNDICKESTLVKNLGSDMLILSQKPTDTNKEYGTMKADNNNSEKETEKAERGDADNGEAKNRQEEDERGMRSHSNPAYVHDCDEKPEQ